MSSRNDPAAATPHPFPVDLDSLARQSGLITRHSRKFSAHGFLLGLLQCATRGTSSLNHLAMALGGFERAAMSRQALHKRLGPESGDFLVRVVGALVSHHRRRRLRPLPDSPFGRILVEDSTVIPMAKSNAGHFPNNGNCKGQTAGCKINLLTDLLGGRVVSSRMHAARRPDQALASDILPHCRPGDLVLRDMGYFTLEALRGIGARDAFWISRMPASISLADLNGERLEERLKRTRRNRLDIPVIIGSERWNQQPLRARLVATRLSPEEAAGHRRHRRREARRHGNTPSRLGLLRDGWRLVVTNLDPSVFPGDRVDELYAARWSVEIQFRAFKQACRLGPSLNHRTGRHHIEALVYAAMIFQLLGLREHAVMRGRMGKGRQPSLEKVSNAYAAYLNTLCATNLHVRFKPDPRHLYHDLRKRITLWESLTYCLG